LIQGVVCLDVLRNPPTVKMLSTQIIVATDAYVALKLPEKQYRELILHFATHHGDKLFRSGAINPTVLNRIGKKRAELVELMLKGFQMSL
jgi:uncharacterized protein (TIGR04540 family)